MTFMAFYISFMDRKSPLTGLESGTEISSFVSEICFGRTEIKSRSHIYGFSVVCLSGD